MSPHLIAQMSLSKAVLELEKDRSEQNYEIIDHLIRGTLISHIGSGREEKAEIVKAILIARDSAPAPYSLNWDWSLELLRDNQNPKLGQCIAFLAAKKGRTRAMKVVGLDIATKSHIPKEDLQDLIDFGLARPCAGAASQTKVTLTAMGRSVYRILKDLE